MQKLWNDNELPSGTNLVQTIIEISLKKMLTDFEELI
jgi:hypothetical protein